MAQTTDTLALDAARATRTEIMQRASQIAGACWDDRSDAIRELPLSAQIRAIADQPGQGSDGDLTDDDRAALESLAREAEAHD